MSDPLIQILTDILNQLRLLNAALARPGRAPEAPSPAHPSRVSRAPSGMHPAVPRILAEWYQRQGSQWLTTRQVGALGLQGTPMGSLRAVAFALSDWTGMPHTHNGATYQLLRRRSHNQSVWSVERLS